MCVISRFLEKLLKYLTGKSRFSGNVIRKHTKNLQQLGDISFPLCIKNWSHFIDGSCDGTTIFDYLHPNRQLTDNLDKLLKMSNQWELKIESYKLVDDNVHLFLNKEIAYKVGLKEVIESRYDYGFVDKIFDENISLIVDNDLDIDLLEINLSELRLAIIKTVTENLVNRLKRAHATGNGKDVMLSLKSPDKNKTKEAVKNIIMCGAVLNDKGSKDVQTTAQELYNKRTVDMQLMAQHKYGVRLQTGGFLVKQYFEKMGKASVTIEMLQNKPHKSIKVSLNNPQTAHKGPSFICYNCARLSALFKEFESRIQNRVYTELPKFDLVDFKLLIQPEEWELFYVYIFQFPLLISSCVGDITHGIINPHNLISCLANMCSVFSVYYRRIKILTNGKDHLMQTLFARIYLLRALQQVFHNILLLLDIEPVKEM